MSANDVEGDQLAKSSEDVDSFPNSMTKSPTTSCEVGVSSSLHERQENVTRIVLSNELKEFYDSHNVNVCVETTTSIIPHRFIRLNPRFDRNETLKLLTKELQQQDVDGGAPNSESDTTNIQKVPWLDDRWGFYALPGSFSIANSPCYQTGRIYGMDVSSGACVAALLTNAYDKQNGEDHQTNQEEQSTTNANGAESSSSSFRVLDLCCAPGLKLCSMADYFLSNNATTLEPATTTIIGVDLSESRIALCKRIIQKYHIEYSSSSESSSCSSEEKSNGRKKNAVDMRLYCQDGTTFGRQDRSTSNLVFDLNVAMEEYQQHGGKRKRLNKSAKGRVKKRLKQLGQVDWNPNDVDEARDHAKADENEEDSSVPYLKLFDRVLVDAECSTDGSLKHLEQKIKDKKAAEADATAPSAATNLLLTDQAQLTELVNLQKKLIESGFLLLKPGGNMVYSTCSLSEEQNEHVVQWLLDSYPTEASIIPLHFPLASSSSSTGSSDDMVTEGKLHGTIRFAPNLDPSKLFGGGFFLAKIVKKSTAEK